MRTFLATLPLGFLLIAVSSANASDALSRLQVSYIAAVRGGYVFPGSDATKVSNLGLVLGNEFGVSGRSHAFRPYGFELEKRFALGSVTFLGTSARVVPAGLRLTPSAPEQTGWDGFVTASFGVLPEIGANSRAGAELGVRIRRWDLESGPMPDTTHGGFVVAARYEGGVWQALFEAGLMAGGFGTPAELGVQRDASTLRARVSYQVELSTLTLIPWIEFFHTHRNFYAATLLPGESSLFVDEASLQIALGISW